MINKQYTVLINIHIFFTVLLSMISLNITLITDIWVSSATWHIHDLTLTSTSPPIIIKHLCRTYILKHGPYSSILQQIFYFRAFFWSRLTCYNRTTTAITFKNSFDDIVKCAVSSPWIYNLLSSIVHIILLFYSCLSKR